MTFLRACFANPIYAYMDCQSVMKIVQRNWKASSDAPEDRAYGALVQAILQVSAPQHPPIDYTQCHPENSRGATVTVPGRSAIPQKDWTLQNHLNVLADTYSESKLPTGLPNALIPHRIMEVEVSILLNAVMPMNGLYWQHDGMPTVNKVGSMSTQKTEDYLQQRSEAGAYYETRYWPGSEVGLLPPVLNIIAPSCNYSQRASFLGLMLDQVPHGRKLAQYENMTEPLPCPMCNAPYETLEHVILACPALSATRAAIKEVAFHPYLLQGNPRSSSSRPLPKPIKKYMNLLLRHAFTGDALSSDVEAVAIWLARPQNITLGQLDQATNAEFDKDNQQRLRKELLKAVQHLTRSARQLWQERCQKASIINGSGTGSPSPMTVSAYSPGTYVSTMTDFFEARSTEAEDPPTSLPEIGHDVCLFSSSSNDQPRATEGKIDRPSVPASLFTQSTVWNTSQLGSGDQTITDRPDHHLEEPPLDTTTAESSGKDQPSLQWPPSGREYRAPNLIAGHSRTWQTAGGLPAIRSPAL
jgi:hypothetical protein